MCYSSGGVPSGERRSNGTLNRNREADRVKGRLTDIADKFIGGMGLLS